jgi:hypothetical protein
MNKANYISVICKDCGKKWLKRKDSIKQWKGRCLSCSRKETLRLNPLLKENSPNWKGGKIRIKCIKCGKIREVYPFVVKKNRRYCKDCKGEATKGEKNWRWNGGIWKLLNRYKMIKVPKHPFANPNGYVYLHRFLMEKKIGRYLKPEEVVHHIDRNRENNNLDNLMIFPNQSKHRRYHLNL